MEELNASILEAASEGNALLLKELLQETPDFNVRKDVLFVLLRKMRHLNGHLYEKCVTVLLEEIPKHEIADYLDVRDEDGRSPLCILGELEHDMTIDFPGYKACNSEAVTNKFLKAGASFADTDGKGMPIISVFRYDRLRRYFDSCITRGKFGTVDFDFKNLLPSRFKSNTHADVIGILLFIQQSYTLRRLLLHPLISTFLIYISHLKWKQIRTIYYTNLAFYSTFYLSVLMQVVNCNTPIGDTWGFLMLTTSLLAVRETFQLAISPRMYFKNLENYLEILIIILVFTASCIQEGNESKQLLVFIFLAATFELMFLIGRHLKLIKYILLFKTVLRIFFTLSFFIGIIIIAFAISFNILFKSDNALFSNPITSILKTIIMATGEYDSDSLALTNYPISSHIILLLFVIIVSIVLMNLIMGLTISDIQRLEKHSKLYGYFATVEFLHQVEGIVCHPKTRLFFEFLERRVHKCLNILGAILPDDCEVWESFSIDIQSKWYSFTSAIAYQDDAGQMKEAVSRLRNLAEKINARLSEIKS